MEKKDFKDFFFKNTERLLVMKIKDIGLIVLSVLLVASLVGGGYFFFRARHIQQREAAARVDAQNRIAELSDTIKIGERTYSRLAQEKEIIIGENEQLRTLINDALTMIEDQNEEIVSLNHTIANFEPVRVVVRRENVRQDPEPPTEPGEPERVRVSFDETWEDFMRIHGFTLTNPAEAEIQVDYTRPVHLAVVVTQREDLSWNSYVSHDVPNLEIDTIETTVNPLRRPQEEPSWADGLYIGMGGAVGRGDNAAGYGFVEVGYDAGDFEIGLLVTGMGWDQGGAFGGGLAFRVNPFAL